MSLPTSERELFLLLCQSALGLPYHWGGRTAAGLDCSGLVAWAALHATAGRMDLTRWWAQLMFDRWEPISTEAAVAGDLAFYGENPEKVTHVMVLLEDGRVIGSAGGGRSTTRSNASPDQCVQTRSGIRYRRDFLGLRRLPL